MSPSGPNTACPVPIPAGRTPPATGGGVAGAFATRALVWDMRP